MKDQDVRFPLMKLLLSVFATISSPTLAGEMFQFLGTKTDAEVRVIAQQIAGDPDRLGFHSVGSAGQTNFDDRTFSFVVSGVTAPITLYALSDDGVTVSISSSTGEMWQPLKNYSVGQAMPNLDQSLQKCGGTLDPGKTYTIVIQYKNTLYTGDGDIDGVVMLGTGGTATANEAPYLTLVAPERMQVGEASTANLREIFPGGPGNKPEMDTQDTTISFAIGPADEDKLPTVGASVTLQVLDGSNNWVPLPGNKFLKGTYPTSGQTARLLVTPAAAGYFKLTVTATDSLGRTDSRKKNINAVGDQALVAVADDYNFLPPANLVVTTPYGFLRNDYIRLPGGATPTVSIVAPPINGDLDGLLNDNGKLDGRFTYKPKVYWDPSKDGLSDTFTYKIEYAALGLTSQATVTIRSARASKCKDSPPEAGTPTPGIMLVGSGNIPDEGIQWLRDHGKGGKLLILSGSGTPSDALFGGELDSNVWNCVTHQVINSPGIANNDSVVEAIENAAAIFIEGGDQTIYYTNWVGTRVQTALQGKVGQIPISGGSAGMHLLGGVVYTPQLDGDGITSQEALADPNSPLMQSFQPAFLTIPNMGGIVTDTHFRERDRMARSLAFVVQSSASQSIMADEGTALMIDGAIGKVGGPGAVYFAAPPAGAIPPGNKLTVGQSDVLRLRAGEPGFDVQSWGPASVSYPVKIDQGTIIPAYPYGPYYGNP
jgi:hypothetical protein